MGKRTWQSSACNIYAPNDNRNVYDDYIDDILLPKEKKKFEKHLETCHACSNQVIKAIQREEIVEKSFLLSKVGQSKSLNKKMQHIERIIANNDVFEENIALAASRKRKQDKQGITFGVAVDRKTGQGSLLECIAVVGDASELKSKLEIRAFERIAVKEDCIEKTITEPSSYLENILRDMFSMYPPLRHFRLFEKTIRVEVNIKGGSGYIDESDSVALAVLVSILSAVTGKAVDGNILFSAGIKINGCLEAVGDLEQKLQIAKQQKMKKCFIAGENNPELVGKTIKKMGVLLHYFDSVNDVLKFLNFTDKDIPKIVRKKSDKPSSNKE